MTTPVIPYVDPNPTPTAVALSSVAAGHLVVTADGKRYLVLTSSQVDLAAATNVGLAAATQVFDHGPARVEVDALPAA